MSTSSGCQALALLDRQIFVEVQIAEADWEMPGEDVSWIPRDWLSLVGNASSGLTEREQGQYNRTS